MRRWPRVGPPPLRLLSRDPNGPVSKVGYFEVWPLYSLLFRICQTSERTSVSPTGLARAGAVNDRAVLGDVRPQREIGGGVCEARCRRGIDKGRLLDRRRNRYARRFHRNVRCPTLSRAARCRARPPASPASRPSHSRRRRQERRLDVELLGRAVEHRLGRGDFGLANGRRHLDVHDHRMLQVNETSIGVRVDGARCWPQYSGPPDRLARSPSARSATGVRSDRNGSGERSLPRDAAGRRRIARPAEGAGAGTKTVRLSTAACAAPPRRSDGQQEAGSEDLPRRASDVAPPWRAKGRSARPGRWRRRTWPTSAGAWTSSPTR